MSFRLDSTAIAAWRPLIPTLRELPAAPRRGILHWTGGPAQPNAIDLQHYHYLFTNPHGWVMRGIHRVRDNMRAISGPAPYAAHTGGFNSYSVGYSFCGAFQAARGRRWGPLPLTETQVRRGCAFVALSFRTWGLNPSSPEELFTHAEAWTLHRVRGTRNHEKWDITELPFLAPGVNVGDWLRATTQDYFNLLGIADG